MKVIMMMQISGARGDDMWPSPGEPLDVSDEEGRRLVNAGIAVEDSGEEKAAEWPPGEERAVVEETSEKRTQDPASPPGDQVLEDVAPRRGPGRPRKDSLPE